MQIKYYKRQRRKQSFAESQRSELMSRTSYSGSYSGSESGTYYSYSEGETNSDEESLEEQGDSPAEVLPSQYNNAYYSDNDSVADICPKNPSRKKRKS